MSVAQIISALNWQSERLLLGKLQSNAQLGLFTTASDISMIPIMAIFVPITRPLLVAFSQVRHDKSRLARSYQTVANAIMTIGLPILVGECLLAEPAIRLVLGDAWLGAVPVLQWLSLSMIPGLFALGALPLVMSVGETKLFVKRNILEFCVKVPMVLTLGAAYGFVGIAVARVGAETAGGLFSILAIRKLTGLSICDQLLGPWRSFVATLVMAPPVIVCIRCLEPAAGVSVGGWARVMALITITAIGTATFATAMWVLWLISGRPHGIESTAINLIGSLVARTRRLA
jgi:PST family polysaccharide transporter